MMVESVIGQSPIWGTSGGDVGEQRLSKRVINELTLSTNQRTSI